jgi:hypothetical protein
VGLVGLHTCTRLKFFCSLTELLEVGRRVYDKARECLADGVVCSYHQEHASPNAH